MEDSMSTQVQNRRHVAVIGGSTGIGLAAASLIQVRV